MIIDRCRAWRSLSPGRANALVVYGADVFMKSKKIYGTITISGYSLQKGALEMQLMGLAKKWGAKYEPTFVSVSKASYKQAALNFKNHLKKQWYEK